MTESSSHAPKLSLYWRLGLTQLSTGNISCLRHILFQKATKRGFSPSKDVNLLTLCGWSYRKSSTTGALSFTCKIKSCRTRNVKVPMKLVLWAHQPWGCSAGNGQRGLIMSCFFNSVWGVYQLIMSLGHWQGVLSLKCSSRQLAPKFMVRCPLLWLGTNKGNAMGLISHCGGHLCFLLPSIHLPFLCSSAFHFPLGTSLSLTSSLAQG